MNFSSRYPEILARYEAFWNGGDTDRPVLYINYPVQNAEEAPSFANHIDRLLPENMLLKARHQLQNTCYAAEGFPQFFVNYGPGVLHACIGGDLHVQDNYTIWYPPFLENLEDASQLKFERDGKWWSRIRQTTDLLLDEIGDEMLISYTDIGGNADVLASLRGTEPFLLDCAMKPEVIKSAMSHVHGLWMQAYEDIHQLLAAKQDVFTPWYQIVAPGRMYINQCDFNAMLSPEMFRDLFAPELGDVWKNLDYSAYHLDGVGTEVHVPALIDQGIMCIQWTPAPGSSPVQHIEMLREIQQAGVSVTTGVKKPGDLETLCRELDPRRLCLIGNAKTEKEAKGIVETALKICEG
jgi:hypothetical protein